MLLYNWTKEGHTTGHSTSSPPPLFLFPYKVRTVLTLPTLSSKQQPTTNKPTSPAPLSSPPQPPTPYTKSIPLAAQYLIFLYYHTIPYHTLTRKKKFKKKFKRPTPPFACALCFVFGLVLVLVLVLVIELLALALALVLVSSAASSSRQRGRNAILLPQSSPFRSAPHLIHSSTTSHPTLGALRTIKYNTIPATVLSSTVYPSPPPMIVSVREE